MAQLMRVNLPHISRDTDRHGNVRHYLRLPGRPKVRLPGAPGSAEFMAAYQAGIAAAQPPQPARTMPPAGSLNALAASYYGSAKFRSLRATSQANYRRIIERLRNAHGTKPVALLDRIGIERLLSERAEHPAAANHLLRCLKALMAHAITLGLRTTDPTEGVKRASYAVKGYRAWTDDEIARFEDHHSSGTKPRLAFALLLYTSARRSDVVRLGRQHLSAGVLSYRQIKTNALVTIPVHPELARELEHVPPGQLTFLARANGKPHTGNGFYNSFVNWCADAGLSPGLSPHGIRKGSLRLMAEEGATAHEIAAVSGHKTLSEVQLYTEAADRVRLAKAGMAKVVAMQKRNNTRS